MYEIAGSGFNPNIPKVLKAKINEYHAMEGIFYEFRWNHNNESDNYVTRVLYNVLLIGGFFLMR